MKCEVMTLSELKNMTPGLSPYSDATIQGLIDSALEYIYGALGHSFGQAIRVWYMGSGVVVTIQVTTLSIILTVDGVSTTLLFTTYPCVHDLIMAIEDQADWEAESILDFALDQPSSNLKTITVTLGGSGYEYRVVLCFEYCTEVHFGRGESHLFPEFPVHSIASIIEDGETLTSSDYWLVNKGLVSWVIRKGCAGGTYYPYTKDLWSMKEENNIVLRYSPSWYLVKPRALREAVSGLILLKVTSTGFKSENIGDYSYSKDGGPDAAFWIWSLRRYQRVWQPRGAWQPGMD